MVNVGIVCVAKRRTCGGGKNDRHASVSAMTLTANSRTPDPKYALFMIQCSMFKSDKHVVTRRTRQQLNSEQGLGNERKQRKYTCRVMLLAI